MHRVFNENHIQLMEEFLLKANNQIIVEPIKKQVTKLLILMDSDEVALLEQFFKINEFTEEEIDRRLRNFGFFSKINLFEKKSILSDVTKRALIRITTSNSKLIDYEKLIKGIEQNYLDLVELPPKNPPGNMNIYKPYKAVFPVRPQENRIGYIYPYCEDMILSHLSEKSLPTVKTKNISIDDVKPVNRRYPVSFYAEEFQRKQKFTIRDLIDDTHIILRKKKALYLEPPALMDYTGEEKFQLNSIKQQIRDLGYEKVGAKLYEGFNPRKFVEEILFKNNGIPIPKKSKYKSFSELRKSMKHPSRFLKSAIYSEVKRLILRQDETLSMNDAKFLAHEMKAYLTLAEIEYFYNRFIESCQADLYIKDSKKSRD